MKDIILEIKDLNKSYKNINVLNNINFSLERGKIYGLIGPNGAGKTTLMRIIAGLSKENCGKVILFGHSDKKIIREQRKRCSFIIEKPSLYEDMNAKQNMELFRTMRGIPNNELDEKLLEMVSLNDDEIKNKRVKNYSIGMKQKLGIAISLLGNPELLVLDEPTNGLDPEGIVEIRKILINLCKEKNITIFISSHILSELYNLATDFIVINNGQIIEEVTHEEVSKRCRRHILLQTNEPERMCCILETELNTRNYKVMNDKSIKLYDYLDDKITLAKAFLKNEILVTNLSCEGDSLEDYYMSIIGGQNV